jgi:nicotinamidase-related amidase
VESFITQLDSLERRTVVICGVETHICVNQTALDLIECGYSVQVPADAVSSRHEKDWQLGLEKMRQSGVVITSREMATFELLKDAACPEFKQILELVK